MLHLRFGRHAESFIADEYERATRLQTHAHEGTLFHPQHGFMFGHVDRFVTEPGAGPAFEGGQVRTNRLLECKTANAFSRHEWGDEGTDQIPCAYLMQCAWYLCITRCQFADVAVLLGNNDFRVYHVERDLELEDMLVSHAQRFWHDHVLSALPPPPVTPGDAALLSPKDRDGSQVEASPEVLLACERYRELLAQSSALGSECDRLKAEILAYMGHAGSLTSGGRTLATWRCAKPARRVDTRALAAAHPEIAAEFSQQCVGARRFLLKEAP
jgi:predicted phage-related endonuclease